MDQEYIQLVQDISTLVLEEYNVDERYGETRLAIAKGIVKHFGKKGLAGSILKEVTKEPLKQATKNVKSNREYYEKHPEEDKTPVEKGTEYIAKKAAEGTAKAVNWLKKKVNKDNDKPIGLSSLNKQTT